MLYSPLYLYYLKHIKEEEEEETEEEVETPSVLDRQSTSPSIDVSSIVKREVKKALSDQKNKGSSDNNASSSTTSQHSASSSSSVKIPSKKPKKSSSHKQSPSVKKKQIQRGSYSSVVKMPILNITSKVPYQLSLIDDDRFRTFLSGITSPFFIFSVCMKQRTLMGNKHLTELLQKELIDNDFCYLPIYVVNDKRQIIDIIFYIFNTQRKSEKKKTYNDLYNFIVSHSNQYGIGSVISFENGRYYQITNKKQMMKCDTYKKPLLHSLCLRGYQKERVSLYFCGKTTDAMTEKSRYLQNEVVV